MLDWDEYRLFATIVSAGSLRAAARRLGVDHAAVSRRLRKIEDKTRGPLLVRHGSRFEVTRLGEDVLAAAERMQAAAHEAERRLAGHDDELAGWVSVSINDMLVRSVVLPRWGGFANALPDVQLDLGPSYDSANLTANEADVAVRIAVTAPDDVIAKKICDFAVAVYASREYLAQHDPRREPESAHWLGWDPDQPYPDALKERFPEVPIRWRVRDKLVQIAAIREGLGIGALACVVADQKPELVRLSEPLTVASVFVMRHMDHRATPRIRAVYDQFVALLDEHRDRLEGTTS